MKGIFVINKLFGGQSHGRVIALSPHQSTHFVARPPKQLYYGTFAAPQVPMQPEYDVYTLRSAAFGTEKLVRYWALSTKSDAEAFDMLTNYLLRGATKL